MIPAILRARLSDPDHVLSSLTDTDLRDALHALDDESDEGVVETLVLLAWHRRLLTVRPAPVADVGAAGLEFVRLMKQLSESERERRLALARAT